MSQEKTNAVFFDIPPEESFTPDDADEDLGVRFIGIFTQLARRKKLIMCITGVAAILGIVISLLLPNKFKSTTRIVTPEITPSAVSVLSGAAAATDATALAASLESTWSMKDPNDIYMGLLQSRTIEDAIIRKLDLLKVFHANDMTGARKALEEETQITSEKSTLLAISVTDKDRNRAAAIANAYVEELDGMAQSFAQKDASERRIFFEGQLNRAKENLVAAQLAFNELQMKKGLVKPDVQGVTIVEGIAALKASLAQKEVELQALRSYSTERNPDVQLVQNELDTLRRQITQLQQQPNSSGFGDLALKDLAGSDMDYLRADHELQYQQAMFDVLLKQYQAAELDEAKNAAVIQVAETAVPADRKASPFRTLIVIVFAFLGFLVACGYVRVSDHVRRHPKMAFAFAEFRSVAAPRMLDRFRSRRAQAREVNETV